MLLSLVNEDAQVLVVPLSNCFLCRIHVYVGLIKGRIWRTLSDEKLHNKFMLRRIIHWPAENDECTMIPDLPET